MKLRMKNKYKKTLTALIIFIVIVSGTLLFLDRSPTATVVKEQPLPKVVLAEMSSPVSSPLMIAHQKGYYREEGLDVEVKSFSIARLGVDAMINNAADFGVAADIVVMNTFAQGHNIYSIDTYSKDKSNKIVARKDRGITSIKDLRGKKIAVVPGTALDAYLFKILEAEGITLDEVTIVKLRVPDMPAALLRGDIDAFSSIEPFVTITYEKLEGNGIILQNKDAYTVTTHILARKDVAEKHPEYVKRFLNAVKKAEQFMENNPVESKKLLASYTGMDPNALDLFFKDVEFSLEQDISKSVAELEEEYQIAIKMGIIQDSAERPDFIDFFYTKSS